MPDRLIGETEPWFKQRVVEMMNVIIRDRGLGFERADAEQSVKVGTRKHLFFDGVLWKEFGQQAVCEFELKRPYIEAADFDLVNNAATKANAIGAPYFVTWNVRDLALWRTFERGKPLLERRSRWWSDIVDIGDVDELRDFHWERIRNCLIELLSELDGLYNRGTHFEAATIDEFFVSKLRSVVASNYRTYSRLIREQCVGDRSYYTNLRRWAAEHGWSALLRPDAAHTDPAAFDVLGRLGVFLLMNRVIFYNMVRAHHRSLAPMTFGDVRSGRDFERRLRRYFDAVLAIDFETVFGGDVFDQLRVPTDSVPYLERFVADLNAYDFSTLNFEILGRVYETLIPERERHALGQYFTPPTTVDLINAFCVRSPTDVVLDPACGAGTFLVRAYARLNALEPRPHRSLLEHLWGIEIAKFPAHIATINLVLPDLSEKENFPYVIAQNAFTVYPQDTEVRVPSHRELSYPTRTLRGTNDVLVQVPLVDAVVGNPPYIERRQLSAADRRIISAAIRHDWALTRFTEAADIFVYFFVHAARFLKEGGRLGFVTSNGWLDHKYGADLQRFLLDNFKLVAVIESRVERSFAQADINTAITILERCSDTEVRENNVIRFVSLSRPLGELLGPDTLAGANVLAERLLANTERAVTDDYRVFPVTQAEARAQGFDEEGKWTGGRWGAVYLRAPDIYFTVLERGAERLKRLRRFGSGVLGTKTGCDEFFVRKDGDLRELGLERRFSRPGYWSPSSAAGFVLRAAEAPERLVLISQPKSHLHGTNALRYIEWGERRRLHHKGECQRRAESSGRWYDLSPQVQSGPIAFAKTYNERHAVLWNPEGCVLGARFVSFTPKDDVDAEVLLALLNSSLTTLFIEILGRTSLGQGALDFAVYEALSIPVLDPALLSEGERDALRDAYRLLIRRNPLPVEDEVRSADKEALDRIVFDALGLSLTEREHVVLSLLGMNRGRLAKAASVERSGRVGLGEPTDEDVLNFVMAAVCDRVGTRRFPRDFEAPRHPITLALPARTDLPRVEHMMTQGALVWSDGHLDCPSPEAAEYAALLLSLGWTRELDVPEEREHSYALLADLSQYVRACETEFERQVAEISSTEAQRRRVTHMFRLALGRAMFGSVPSLA